MELEQRLKRAVLIQEPRARRRTVSDLGRYGHHSRGRAYDEPEETYFIVGSAEASPANGRISNESPMGKALMGKRMGACTSCVRDPQRRCWSSRSSRIE
jgi:transcription elongation factor GreA